MVGHTVRGCSDVGAMSAVNELMSESELGRALALCRDMAPRYVSFALCHGFGVAVSGGRVKLLQLVRDRFPAPVVVPVQVVPVPVQVVPVPVPVVSPPVVNQDVFRISVINEMIQEESAKRDQFVAILNAFDRGSLRHCVQFIPTHPRYSAFAGMCNSDLEVVRHNEIKRVANRVITIMLETISNAQMSQPGLNTDVYVNTLISDLDFMDECISEAMPQLHVGLSRHAIDNVMTYIKFQNSGRRLQMLNNHLERSIARYTAVPDVMKKLKTVVVCRDVNIKQEEAVTCGICFDSLAPECVVKTGCDHDFCVDCISGWAKQRGIKSFISCPCCRSEIDTMSVGGVEEREKLEGGLCPV
jgi:hypothetical protein